MNKQKRYALAAERIAARRRNAEMQQEQRTMEIYRQLPETVEIDRCLRDACMNLLQPAENVEEKATRMAMIRRRTEEARHMMESVLEANGYPADYLDIRYTCPQCSDTGLCGGTRCSCFVAELGRIGAEELSSRVSLSQYGFDRFSMAYYRDLTAENYQKMQRIFDFCKEYAADFSMTSPSVLMCGKTGLGKTHLSLSIVDVVLQKGFSVIYDSAGRLLHRVEQEHFGKGSAEESDTLSQLLQCDLLVLDDFGTEFSTTFTRSALYTVINERLNACKPMIINTNLTLEEIQRDYGDRIVSRLFASCKWLDFVGSDIRLRKMMESSVR